MDNTELVKAAGLIALFLMAIEHGLLKPEDLINQDVVAFAFALVEERAVAADLHGHEENGGNGGEAVRVILGDGPDG